MNSFRSGPLLYLYRVQGIQWVDEGDVFGKQEPGIVSPRADPCREDLPLDVNFQPDVMSRVRSREGSMVIEFSIKRPGSKKYVIFSFSRPAVVL